MARASKAQAPSTASDLNATPMQGRAVYSPCGQFRYALWRDWACGSGRVAFIGCNPSTATAREAAPSVRRCMGYAFDWGYAGITMLNIFALRSTDPEGLRQHPAPIGPLNDRYLLDLSAEADLVIACWGAITQIGDRWQSACDLLAARNLHSLGLSADGHPRHPLYLRKDAKPERYAG